MPEERENNLHHFSRYIFFFNLNYDENPTVSLAWIWWTRGMNLFLASVIVRSPYNEYTTILTILALLCRSKKSMTSKTFSGSGECRMAWVPYRLATSSNTYKAPSITSMNSMCSSCFKNNAIPPALKKPCTPALWLIESIFFKHTLV